MWGRTPGTLSDGWATFAYPLRRAVDSTAKSGIIRSPTPPSATAAATAYNPRTDGYESRGRLLETTSIQSNTNMPGDAQTLDGGMLDEIAVEPGAVAPVVTLGYSPPATEVPLIDRGLSNSRLVFVLALPMLGEQLLNFTVGLVDTWLAGSISKEATAAVGTASYMGWFMTLGFSLISIGAAAVVSRAFGARDVPTANRALNQAVVLAAIIGAGLSAAAFALAPWSARIVSEPVAQQLAFQFLQIDAGCYLPTSLTFIGAAILRAAGDARTPLRIMIVVNLANLALATSLVFGWTPLGSLGVIGIVCGTLAARWIGAILTLIVLLRGLHGLRLQTRLMRPELPLMWRILRIGLPAAADSGVMAAAQFAFIYVIAHTAAGELGTVAYAAHMIAMRVEALSYLPAFAWGMAAATLVGQNLGARRPQDATRAGHTAALHALVLVSLVGVCFFLFARPIYNIMTDDPQVQAVGANAFQYIAFAQPFIGLAIVYMNALRGAGDTRWPMLFSIICGVFVRVPVAYLGGVVLGGGLIGAWCGMWADNVLRSILCFTRYVHGGWRKTRV